MNEFLFAQVVEDGSQDKFWTDYGRFEHKCWWRIADSLSAAVGQSRCKLLSLNVTPEEIG